MESKFVKLSKDSTNWAGYTLIISSVSVGNVGQLSLDLLLSSMPGFEKAAYLITPLVQPLVGYNDRYTDLNLTCDSKPRLILT